MRSILRTLSLVAIFLATGCASSGSKGRDASQAVFPTPEAAVEQLVASLTDRSAYRFRNVLGPEADDVLATGDSVQFAHDVDQFLQLYRQKHQTVVDGDVATLLVGDDDWPMPIPLVRDDEGWWFDTAAGRQEMLDRRIGRNELSAIQVCRAIVDAQADYRTMNPMGDGGYATKFASDPGTKNGLYWPVEEGSVESPLGELVAAAQAEGYRRDESGARTPYHGYYYRILTAQGDAAPGGERSYLVDGKLLNGFAVVAWPAHYGNSGVMTFIVNQQGVVYERDLGKNSAKIAERMSEFDPGRRWVVSED